MLFSLVIKLSLMDLVPIGFLELMILFKNLFFVTVIDINIYNFLPLFNRGVLVFKPQFFTELFFQPFEFFILTYFGSFTIVNGCGVGLVKLRLVPIHMWVKVESFQVVPIDNSPNWLPDIGSTITLRCRLIEILLESGIRH